MLLGLTAVRVTVSREVWPMIHTLRVQHQAMRVQLASWAWWDVDQYVSMQSHLLQLHPMRQIQC